MMYAQDGLQEEQHEHGQVVGVITVDAKRSTVYKTYIYLLHI
jgi:hypothetical protein